MARNNKKRIVLSLIAAALLSNAAAAQSINDLIAEPRFPSVEAFTPQWPNVLGLSDDITGAIAPPPSSSAAWTWRTLPQVNAFDGDIGIRYWVGFGSTAKNLYDTTGSEMVSRLTYSDLQSHAIEAYFRLDHTSGFFIKGAVGGGDILGGNLNDEDFPPGISPYSSTNSDLRQSFLAYGNIDFGYNVLRGGDFKVGAFVGYNFLTQRLHAYGCDQIATNPSVCAPGDVAADYNVISQNNRWHAMRVGINAEATFAERFKVSVDAAWLPLVRFDGEDSHHARIGTNIGDFTGPVPEDGNGKGYQLQASLSYKINNYVDVGLGARYWHMDSKGHTHFEDHVVGMTASPQVLEWRMDHFGVFLQAGVKFGPYSLP